MLCDGPLVLRRASVGHDLGNRVERPSAGDRTPTRGKARRADLHRAEQQRRPLRLQRVQGGPQGLSSSIASVRVRPDRHRIARAPGSGRFPCQSRRAVRRYQGADDRQVGLSRDSWLGQRNGHPLAVQVVDCLVNGTIEVGDASECLMSQVVRLQVVPDDLDVVEFRGIFR